MRMIFEMYGIDLGSLFAGIILGCLIVIFLIIILSRLVIVSFSEQEVLEHLKDWQTFPDLKKLIEVYKPEGTNISGLSLEHTLKKLECEKKIESKVFALTNEEALRLDSKTLAKFKII